MLSRAIAITREDYPWINLLFQPELNTAHVLAAIESFGMPVVMAGGQRLLAVMIELLGHIVGMNMALHLVKHIGISGSYPAISASTEGEVDE